MTISRGGWFPTASRHILATSRRWFGGKFQDDEFQSDEFQSDEFQSDEFPADEKDKVRRLDCFASLAMTLKSTGS